MIIFGWETNNVSTLPGGRAAKKPTIFFKKKPSFSNRRQNLLALPRRQVEVGGEVGEAGVEVAGDDLGRVRSRAAAAARRRVAVGGPAAARAAAARRLRLEDVAEKVRADGWKR